MTTDIEALRAQFEAWATAAYRLSFDDDTPLKRYLWTAYQAGHAAAKAEIATAGAPMAMVQCHGNAAHPLYTAEQLAAAAAAADAEREKCAGIVNELRMECALAQEMAETAEMNALKTERPTHTALAQLLQPWADECPNYSCGLPSRQAAGNQGREAGDA